MKMVFSTLLVLVGFHGPQALAGTVSNTYNCTISKIETTAWDLVNFPVGTKQEIRMLYLKCDEETFSGSHDAFVVAPISLLANLQARKAAGTKSAYTVTFQGYAGELLAIDGQNVGSIQPDQRADLTINLSDKSRFVEGTRLTEILKQNCNACAGNVQLEGQDSTFRIQLYTSRLGGSGSGDGRGTPGTLFVNIAVAAHLPTTANPGDSLELSALDSSAVSNFLLLQKFPAALNINRGSITCVAADSCFIIQNQR